MADNIGKPHNHGHKIMLFVKLTAEKGTKAAVNNVFLIINLLFMIGFC